MRPYAIVAPDFARTGGMDLANHALAAHLARAGRVVHLVGYRTSDDLLAYPNVVVHRAIKPADAYSLGGPFLGSLGLLQAMRARRQGGVVVSNGGNCPFPGANWVHYVHAGHPPIVAGAGWRAAKAVALHRINVLTEQIALRAARVAIANSERTRHEVVDRCGVAPERVHTVYLGVDPVRFRPPSESDRHDARRELGWDDERPRVVFVGALGDRRKGFDVVYGAWRILCASPSWDADLAVVGRGAELAAWRDAASRDGLAGRVAFLGFREDVPRILAACDALVAPTRYEPYGLGIHEAICCGIPAIVSASAGVAERYPATLRDLLLSDPNSVQALAASLVRWRERAVRYAAGVRPFADALRARTWDDMARDIVALCDGLA